MSGLTGLCACVCVFRVGARCFSCLVFGFTWGGKETWSRSDLSPPFKSSGQKKKKAAKKPTPAAFPLRLFQEISNHSAEAALCAKASIVLSVQRTALLCVSTTSFGSRYSLRRLMFADLPHTSETTDNSPTTVPPASLVCVFFVAWRIKNCLRSCSALTSRAVLFFFFLGPCCSIHPKPLCGGDPRAVLAMFVFSLMYLVTFLRRV